MHINPQCPFGVFPFRRWASTSSHSSPSSSKGHTLEYLQGLARLVHVWRQHSVFCLKWVGQMGPGSFISFILLHLSNRWYDQGAFTQVLYLHGVELSLYVPPFLLSIRSPCLIASQESRHSLELLTGHCCCWLYIISENLVCYKTFYQGNLNLAENNIC